MRDRKTRKGITGGVSQFRIPKGVAAWLVVLFCIYVLSGGFYDLLEPKHYDYWLGRVTSIHHDFGAQTIYEGRIVFISNTLMFIGLWLCHRSGHGAYDTVKANRLLLIGIGFFFTGLFCNYFLLEVKRSLWQ